MVVVHQFDILLITLDPTIGAEIQKSRPCVVISPDSMNRSRLQTVIVAPMTSTVREGMPTRVNIHFQNKQGQIALDQLRALDRTRIIKKLGSMEAHPVGEQILRTLRVMFG